MLDVFDRRCHATLKYLLDVDVEILCLSRALVCEPGVFKDFSSASCGAQSLLGLLGEKGIDDVCEVIGMRDSHLVWNLNLTLHDQLVLLLKYPVVKREYACQHLVHDRAHSPPVGREAVALTLEKLGGEVCWRSCHFVRDLVVPQHSCHAEVSNLEVTSLVQEQVLQLQISMHDIVVVKVLEPIHKLDHVKLYLLLLKAAVRRMLEDQ